MSVRVEVPPELIRWACARDGKSPREVDSPALPVVRWLDGTRLPTLNQLEAFARKTHTPVGYLMLREPPVIELPIPDFRTHGNEGVRAPSTDLLATIYECQLRQAWYRDYMTGLGGDRLSFIGSASVDDEPEAIGRKIRSVLQIDQVETKPRNWEEARKLLISRLERLGVLVSVNGVVGNDNTRALDLNEFRGFALVDEIAPVIFVNSHDSRAAQIFTLAHEAAHLWLGEGGVDDADATSNAQTRREKWCNAVAVELLVPRNVLARRIEGHPNPLSLVQILAREFKVSTLSVIRRLPDVTALPMTEMWNAYHAEVARIKDLDNRKRQDPGGNFHANLAQRVSRRFAEAVVRSAESGRLRYRDAYHLLGVKGDGPYQGFRKYMGVHA